MTNKARLTYLEKALKAYADDFRNEQKTSHLLAQLEESLFDENGLFDRSNMRGHLTSSALVVNDAREVLMIKHPYLGKWLQPGGHVDLDQTSIIETAMRETLEETGYHTQVHPWTNHGPNGARILDIETHFIPANAKKNEGFHYHHDIVYLLTTVAGSNIEKCEFKPESISWFSLKEIAERGKKSIRFNRFYAKILETCF